MRPSVKKVLGSLLSNMEDKMAALPKGSPESLALFGITSVLTVAERDWDEAAHLRYSEIQTLVALLERGKACVNSQLSTYLSSAILQASEHKNDLRISSLEKTLDSLRAALIELQADLETLDSADAKTLLRDTWQFLAESNKQRNFFRKPW